MGFIPPSQWWAHVSNTEVLQRSGLSTIVTSYVVNAYLCLAMLHAWTLDWSTSSWCSASDGEYLRRQKANGQLEKTAGSPGSTMSRRMPALYRCLRCGDLRSPGVTERRNGPLRLRDDDDDDDGDDLNESPISQKWSEAYCKTRIVHVPFISRISRPW